MGDNNFSRQSALKYHEKCPHGKIGTSILKPINDEQDLALAYTPGVALVVEEIIKDPNNAYRYTNKGHMVAVISNGSAVLGLGNTGALASKPVMEGKASLIKSLSDLDAIDIEIDCDDPAELVNIIKRISPSFGAILLEDIKAPDCFYVEQQLQKQLDIPVFHDDQHGTAIVVTAALINALRHQNKSASQCKVVLIGTGAAGHAIFNMLLPLGIHPENIFAYDRQGLIHQGREAVSEHKKIFRTQHENISMKDAFKGADIIIGVSSPNLITADDLKNLAPKPIILALSNPIPEVDPELVKQVRPDVLLCTGSSKYSNQVNNIVSFPYLLKGLITTRTIVLTSEIKWQMAELIAKLSQDSGSEEVIPKALDPRLHALSDQMIAFLKKE